jgi:hypothetical protein
MQLSVGSRYNEIQSMRWYRVPIISSVTGFVEYVGVQVGEDVALTISLFETQEQAEESTRRAAEWIRQNMAPFAAGPHEIVAAGEVRFRKAR